MTRTLITGAAGFTGHYIGQLLAARGHEVHGVVHEQLVDPIPGVARFHEADICDSAAIKRVITEVQPRHVVHLAAIAFVGHGDLEQMYRVNIVGTRQVLEALSSLGEPPASILVASSANVYGNAREGALDEASPPAPANDYGVSKLAMEHVVSIYRPRLPLIITRPFNYTGRGQEPQFIIAKIVDHVRRRAPTIELGNIDVARDFSDVRFVADAYSKLLSNDEAIGGTFNICSGRPVSVREVVKLASDISGHRLDICINPQFVRSNEIRSLYGSAALLERTVGPLAAISLEDTLRWMIDG